MVHEMISFAMEFAFDIFSQTKVHFLRNSNQNQHQLRNQFEFQGYESIATIFEMGTDRTEAKVCKKLKSVLALSHSVLYLITT